MRRIEICRFCEKNIWPWQKKVIMETRRGYMPVIGDEGTSQGYSVDLCRHGACTGSINFYESLLWKIRHPRLWFRKYIVKAALVGILLFVVGCGWMAPPTPSDIYGKINTDRVFRTHKKTVRGGYYLCIHEWNPKTEREKRIPFSAGNLFALAMSTNKKYRKFGIESMLLIGANTSEVSNYHRRRLGEKPKKKKRTKRKKRRK